ncbi:MAG TPA: transposase [Ktedonobacteraceae bacterium]
MEVQEQGMKPKEIAGRLGMSDRTLRDWLKRGAFPEAKRRRKRQSSFDAFAPNVLKRWQSGERNGLVLFQEIKAQGYPGTERSVYRSLKTLKQAEVSTASNPARIQKYSANTAVWLFVRDLDVLQQGEREDLATFCQASAVLKRAYGLVQEFLTMVHKREGHCLDAWLEKIMQSDLPELQSFACGVEKDKAAVRAGLTWPVNNGMVEGFVTKLKLIKRQMYGKAGFALLRQRVLHAL